MKHRIQPTRLGDVALAVDDEGTLTGLWFVTDQAHAPSDDRLGERDDTVAAAAAAQLVEFLDGARTSFELNLAPQGTPFQQRVWRALLDIPYGETSTYGRLATTLGSSARAVGTAVGRNPIGIIVPCHRVVGADGALTGYAGGLPRKTALLTLEGAILG